MKKQKKDINLIFVGDLFLKEGDKISLDKNLKKIIGNSDITSCNFEGPIKTERAKPILKAGPNLVQSKDLIKQILPLGFNLINLSNNHIMDYGEVGLEETLKKLEKTDYLGAGKNFKEAYSLKTIKIKNKRIGFLSFSEWGFGVITPNNESSPGFAWINHPETNKIIKNSKKKVDFLIVQAHAGEEDIDLPQPEWRKRYKEILDCGANLIVGHHPHIPQPMEIYKGKLIFYSLGNFYFKKFQKKFNYLLNIELDGDKKNKITWEIIPIMQKDNNILIVRNSKLENWIKDYFRKTSEREYLREYKKMAGKRYRETYLIYFKEKKIVRTLKNILKKILNKEVVPREIIIEHLDKRESHKFIINENKNNLK